MEVSTNNIVIPGAGYEEYPRFGRRLDFGRTESHSGGHGTTARSHKEQTFIFVSFNSTCNIESRLDAAYIFDDFYLFPIFCDKRGKNRL